MKVMILSVTAGFGHHATAKAVGDMFEAKGDTVQIVDIYEYISKLVYDTISKGYLLSTKYAPKAYSLFYKSLEKKDKDDLLLEKLNIINHINTFGITKFQKVIDDFEPDAIVCTHVFSAQLMEVMIKENLIKALTVGIITDFTIHPFWEEVKELDYIVTASELLTLRAEKKGIEKTRQLPFGIPINPKFNKGISKKDAREQLGLDAEIPVILVMGGSMGYSNGKRIVKAIDRTGFEFQIVAVCGNNEKQFNKLTKYKAEYSGKCKINILGFVNYVDVLMDAADCIVTKPGGLTVSEALAKRLPLILVDPIPGQEERNVEFLVNNGLASKVSKTYPLDEALFQMFENPHRLKNINDSIDKISKPNATADLICFIKEKFEKSRNSNEINIDLEK